MNEVAGYGHGGRHIPPGLPGGPGGDIIPGWVPALIAIKTDSQAPKNNSTTLITITQLGVAIAAAGLYLVEWHILWESGSTPDIKFSFSTPTGLTGVAEVVYTNTAAAVVVYSQDITSGGVIDIPGLGATTPVLSTFRALVRSGGLGTLDIQFAQNTANVSDTTILNDSNVFSWKIA